MTPRAALGAALLMLGLSVAAIAEPLRPGPDGRVSLLSEAPSTPETGAFATPEAVLAAWRAGTLATPEPLAGYFTAHWFVVKLPADAPLAVAVWQALIAQIDLWVYEGDRLVHHRRAGVSVDAPGAAPRFAAGYALPVPTDGEAGRILVLRVEPLLFLGTDVELATEAHVRQVATVRAMLFPAVLGVLLGVAILHAVLGLRFGDWRNSLFAGALAVTFLDWCLWLGGPQALGVVTARDIGFGVVAGATYADTFAFLLLFVCLFADPLRRRRKVLAGLTAVFAAYVILPLVPQPDAGRHLVATLVLTAAKLFAIALMARPALAARAPGTRCALAGTVVLALQSVLAFAPMALPGMAGLNTAITARVGHYDSMAITVEILAFTLISLSLWDRHRAAMRAREVAEMEARLEAIRVAQICHDIRSPLHAVQSLLTALDLEAPGQDRRSDIAEARGVLGSVRDLVEDIVAAAREGDGAPGREGPVRLEAVARRTAAAVRGLCDMRGVPVEVQIAPDAPETVRTDRIALERILSNLASNAARVCRAGPLEIAVEPGPDGMAARLRVRDDGPGLPPDTRARLLGERGPTGTAAPDGAMGLTVVRSLAEALGARIGVAPGHGAGTAITVDLPKSVAPATDAPERGGLRLLLVEDDPVTQAALRAILRAEGHYVTTAAERQRAVDAAASGGFDAALVDLDLGAERGCDTIRAIRKLPDPVKAGLPALILSGHPDSARIAQGCGAQGVLPKPFDRADLRAALAPIAAQPADAPLAAQRIDHLTDLAATLSAEGFRDLIDSARAQIHAAAGTVLDPEADMDATRKAAHRLGGAAAIVGLSDLSLTARACEAAAAAGDRSDLAARRTLLQARLGEALSRLASLQAGS